MSDKIEYIYAGNYHQKVIESKGPVVVDFYSTECPPCEALASKYEHLAELYGDDISFFKIFRQESRTLAESMKITGSPTVLFYQSGKQVGDVLTGGIRRADLERNLKTLIAPEVVEKIEKKKQPVKTTVDVAILGAGPAGIATAIYAAQAKLDVLVIDKALSGGNVSITHQVSNYPGFVEPLPGYLLAHYMGEQAKTAGAKFREAVDVTRVDLEKKEIVIDELETVTARRIVIATGSSPRPLGIEGEQEYKGKGISYCATCDAKYYEDKHVVVIGGGNTAIEESLFIDKFSKKITVVHQFDYLQANKQAADKARANPNIEFMYEHEPRAFVASGGIVDSVVVEELKTGNRKSISCDGVFVFAGMQPNLELFKKTLDVDEWGYLKVDGDMHTNISGVFAVGDVCSKFYRQITTAVSDGTIAAMALAKELGA